MPDSLTLPEQIALIHLDSRSGRFEKGYLNPCLILATIAELESRYRIRIDQNRVVVWERKPTEDDLLDMVLSTLASEQTKLTLESLACHKRLNAAIREAVCQRLIRRGILKKQEEPYLLLLHRTVYKILDSRQRDCLRAAVHDAAIGDTDASQKMGVLVGLLSAGNTLDLILSSEEIKRYRSGVARLVESNALSNRLSQTLTRIIDNDAAASATVAMVASS